MSRLYKSVCRSHSNLKILSFWVLLPETASYCIRKHHQQHPILGNKGWLEAKLQPDLERAISSASSLLPDAGWEQ